MKNSTKKLLSFLFGLIIGMLTSVTSAVEVEPTFPIQTPADADTHGLEDLRKALKRDGVPGPNLNKFLKNGPDSRKALLELGKALFHEMQIGSGGNAGIPSQACASCHFSAGADIRPTNQLNPDLLRVKDNRNGDIIGFHNANADPDPTFAPKGPNQTLAFADFPFVKNPNKVKRLDNGTIVPADGNSNDVASSMGVFHTEFIRTIPAEANDVCQNRRDEIFTDGQQNFRRVEPRHTPTVINAVLFQDLFWDGRADDKFNGVNPFGHQDPDARIFVFKNGEVVRKKIRVKESALASQAVGPPLSDFEMSCGVPAENNARTWPEIGRKIFRKKDGQRLKPLALQKVSKNDSILGELSNAPSKGLNTTYRKLVKKVFRRKYWRATEFRFIITDADVVEVQPARPVVNLTPQVVSATPLEISLTEDEIPVDPEAEDVVIEDTVPPSVTEQPQGTRFNLMEINTALFFGLAVQEYQRTLIADNTPFDKWMRTGKKTSKFGKPEIRGLNVFVDKGKCINCHGGPELTNASVRNAQNNKNIIEPMVMGNNDFAIYDNGFYNIGVTPTVEDLGRGGKGPTGAPLASSRQRLFEEVLDIDIPFNIQGGNHVPAVTEDENELVCNDRNNNGRCELNERLHPNFQRAAVDGAMKTAQLRNIQLNGPYFHNGAFATLRQVVEFYDNGGYFCDFNQPDLDPDIQRLGLTDAEKSDLVKFLVSLTDRRVTFEKAPFDHPELIVAKNGVRNGPTIRIPPVGKKGRKNPIKPFLNLNPQDLGKMDANFECRSDRDN
ncbi:MAG: hypothetical protein V3V31_02535 [Methylococcales bacterium]